MSKGRKPLPTALKLLTGNAGHRAKADLGRGEPNPEVSLGEAPAHLNEIGQAYWFAEGGQLLKTRVITVADHDAFGELCFFHQQKMRLVEQIARLEKKKTPTKKEIWQLQVATGQLLKLTDRMQKIRIQFGMTPASRTSIKIDTGQADLPGFGTPTDPLAEAARLSAGA